MPNRLVEQGQLPHRLVPRRSVPTATGIFAHAAEAKVEVLQAVAVQKRQPDFARPDLAMGIGNARRIEWNPAKRSLGATAFSPGQFHFLALLSQGRLSGGNGLNCLRMQAQPLPGGGAIGVLLQLVAAGEAPLAQEYLIRQGVDIFPDQIPLDGQLAQIGRVIVRDAQV